MVNTGCMKDILRYVKGKAGMTVKDDVANYKHIVLLDMFSDIKKETLYSDEDFAYAYLKCHDYGYLKDDIVIKGTSLDMKRSSVYDITPTGEMFCK